MIPDLFQNTTVPILQEVMSFTQARHNVLAGNIANVDTPNYRVRDLSVENFQERLREAIAARHVERESLGQGGSFSEPDVAMQDVRDTLKSITFLDNSDVGIEQQVTEIAKNQIMHNLAVTILSSQFRLLQTAISERV
jgi:flagellar basal-body rod protein FlgB